MVKAGSDPKRMADMVLAAAVRGIGDVVYLEPAGDAYCIAFERAGQVHANLTVEGRLCTAVIARLAMIANLDLCANHATTGVVPVRSGSDQADVVITVRPGSALRADLSVMPRVRARPAVGDAGPTFGSTVGSYRVLEPLGEGGMGTVYRAEHVVLGRQAALKVLRAKFIERDQTAAHRFLREARAAARIHHPNIVDVFDFGHLADGRPYFVMEVLAGESLLARVDRGPLPPNEAVAIARQLAGALAAAHDVGVIHADVTPANAYIVSTEPLVVKLLDFGLAELAGETVRPDESAEFVLGTPSYISPEQLRGLAATDRSDQYSLGAVLFEMLSGTPPYVDDDLRKLCLKHVTAPIPDVMSKFGPLPPALGDVITTCLQKSPQARFPGMRALITALDEVERITDRSGWRRYLSS